MLKLLLNIYNGTYNIGLGMWTTFKHLFKPAITIQYPDEKRTPNPAFRGNLQLHKGKCTACMICVNYCPNFCISVKYDLGEDKKRKLSNYTVDMGKCMYCGICVDVCPFGANYWDQTYERSVYDRSELIERKDV